MQIQSTDRAIFSNHRNLISEWKFYQCKSESALATEHITSPLAVLGLHITKGI